MITYAKLSSFIHHRAVYIPGVIFKKGRKRQNSVEYWPAHLVKDYINKHKTKSKTLLN